MKSRNWPGLKETLAYVLNIVIGKQFLSHKVLDDEWKLFRIIQYHQRKVIVNLNCINIACRNGRICVCELCPWEIFVVQKKPGFNFENCYISVAPSVVLSQFDTTICKTITVSVMYPEISWADPYTHQTQEGTTTVGAEGQNF